MLSFHLWRKKLCFYFAKSIMREHRRIAILHFFFFLAFFCIFFFKKESDRERAGKIIKNWQKCNSLSASKSF